ncbi:MAG: hypothetical protein QXD13_01620 [Candidatus Pacearchaeota archaeon]
MEIEKIIKKLAMRKLRLKKLESIMKDYPKEVIYPSLEKIIRNERVLLKQAELNLSIYIKKLELEYYQNELEILNEKREDSYCPACKYLYETSDGRELTEKKIIEENVQCTLHPGKEFEGYCPDFKDGGYVNFDVYFKQKYDEIKIARQIMQKTETEISELEKELGSTKLEH